MTNGSQMQIYIKRWHQSEYVLDPLEEVVVDTVNPEELKRKVRVTISYSTIIIVVVVFIFCVDI